MSQTFIETLNGQSKEVEYLTPDEMMTELERDILVRVSDVMKSNEGFDMKDALIYSLDKGIIGEVDYDIVYPVIMDKD
jgi:hypothetical protein